MVNYRHLVVNGQLIPNFHAGVKVWSLWVISFSKCVLIDYDDGTLRRTSLLLLDFEVNLELEWRGLKGLLTNNPEASISQAG